MMNKSFISHGACVMIGLICGALLAWQPAPPAPAPDGREGEYRLEWNGNPDNWSVVKGVREADGTVEWWPDRQSFRPPPDPDGPRGGQWVVVEVNGRPVTMRGRKGVDGRPRWRIEDQRTKVLLDAPGVALPSGYVPRQDPSTGALLMGVDPKGLAADDERIRASDPKTRAEVEDVRKFYAMGPDASAKLVARNLPKVISPNSWATLFGYDIRTAGLRLAALAMLAGSLFIVHRKAGACR